MLFNKIELDFVKSFIPNFHMSLVDHEQMMKENTVGVFYLIF